MQTQVKSVDELMILGITTINPITRRIDCLHYAAVLLWRASGSSCWREEMRRREERREGEDERSGEESSDRSTLLQDVVPVLRSADSSDAERRAAAPESRRYLDATQGHCATALRAQSHNILMVVSS